MTVYLGLNDIRRDGMGSAAVTLIHALRAHGITVQPIHAWRAIDWEGYEEDACPIFVEGNTAYGLDGQTLGAMVATVNDLAQDGDVFIHFGSPNWVACIPYFKEGLRVITAVHSINPSTLKICRAYAPRVSAFVCISKGVQRRFLSRFPRDLASRVCLIPNAVEKQVPPKDDYSLRSPLRILYVGRIENTSKGCGKLPRILALLRKRGIAAQLDLYGYFHNWERQFWARVDALGVRGQVNYRGEIAHGQIGETMRDYDIFVVPSNFEGFPLSTSEAMMVGLPVVASRITGVTDWLLDGGRAGLLVDKSDLPGFAEAITRIAREPGLAERLGRAAYKRISGLASFETHGRVYAELSQAVSRAHDYSSVRPPCGLEHYVVPEILKPWGPARVLPTWLKTWLRRFM